jgi:hypothetical protein
VCDTCNAYFGNITEKLPAIETVLKETFNISRAFFHLNNNDIGKNKSLPKFSSVYFNLDVKRLKFSLKAKYKYHRYFQENVGRQLRRGIYKIYLEERERQLSDSLDDKYNFMREFARYCIGDYPVYYFERVFGIIPTHPDLIKNPTVFFKEEFRSKYLVSERGYFEFELFSHVFGIPTTRSWELGNDFYLKSSVTQKKGLFKGPKAIVKFNDIDLTLSVMGDKK